jgi:hypothetical protein
MKETSETAVTPEKESDGAAHVDSDTSDEAAFSLENAAGSDLVGRYQPKFLARGGDQLVYEIPDHPDVVAKAAYPLMRLVQEKTAATGGKLSPEGAVALNEHLQDRRRRFSRMRSTFGEEHVLAQKQYLMQVPVTPELVDRLHGGKPPAGAKDMKEVWTIVAIQPKAEEFSDVESLSITSGYLENQPIDPERYRRMTEALASEGGDAEFTWEEFLAAHPWEKELFATLEREPDMAAAVGDFVGKAVKYVEETGETLDLAGAGNVALSKRNGKWDYRLIDALYPGFSRSKGIFTSAKEAIAKAAAGETIDEGEKSRIKNALNFTRTINALARKLGREEKLVLIPEEAMKKIDFQRLLERGNGD